MESLNFRALFSAIFICIASCSFLSAYDGPKGQVFGGISVSILDDAHDANPDLHNVSYGFGVGFRKSEHVGFRGDVNYFSDSKDHVAYPYDISLWDFGGDFMYYFNESSHQPYVFGGARILNYHQTSGSPGIPALVGATTNSLGIDFGIGIQSFMSRSISFRPEFRFVYDSNLDEHNAAHSHMLNFTAAVAYHW